MLKNLALALVVYASFWFKFILPKEKKKIESRIKIEENLLELTRIVLSKKE